MALCASSALVVMPSFGADAAKPACCAKPAKQAVPAKGERLRCSLTGKVVDECCCVQRNGKTHCTLADKDVTTCCCRPAGATDSKQSR